MVTISESSLDLFGSTGPPLCLQLGMAQGSRQRSEGHEHRGVCGEAIQDLQDLPSVAH